MLLNAYASLCLWAVISTEFHQTSINHLSKFILRASEKVTCSCFSYKNKFMQYRTQAENSKKKNCFQSSCVIHIACLNCNRSLGQECILSVTKYHFSVNWSEYFHLLHSFMLISSHTLPILWKILHIPPKYLSLLLCKHVFSKHQLDILMFKFIYTHIYI